MIRELAQVEIYERRPRPSRCSRYGGAATVEIIAGADHGFHVRKSSGRDDDEVLVALLDHVQRWEAETFPD